MKRPRARSIRTLVAAGTVAASAALLVGAAAPADAQIGVIAVVANRFERTCSIGCSPFEQVNGAFNTLVPSDCVTKYPGPWPPDKVTRRGAGTGPCTEEDG